MKMSYYLFNRQKILQKAKKKKKKKTYSKEKAAEYYLQNKRQGIVIRTCQRKIKTKSKSIKRRGIKN